MEDDKSTTTKGYFTTKSTEYPASEDAYLKSLSITSPVMKLPDSPSSTVATISRTPTPKSTLSPPAFLPTPTKYRLPGVRDNWTWEHAAQKDESHHSSRKDDGHEQATRLMAVPRSRNQKPSAPVRASVRDPLLTYSPPTVTKTTATATALTSGIEEYFSKYELEAYSPFSSASYYLPPPLPPHLQQKKLADVLIAAKSKSVTKRPPLSPKHLQGSQRGNTSLGRDIKLLPFFVEEKPGYFTEKELCEARSGDLDSETTEDDEEWHDDYEGMVGAGADEEWHVVKDELAEGVVVERPDVNEIETIGERWELISPAGWKEDEKDK